MNLTEIIDKLRIAKTDIASAITEKGVILNEGDGFSDFAEAIRAIKPPPEYGLVTFTATIPTSAIITIT